MFNTLTEDECGEIMNTKIEFWFKFHSAWFYWKLNFLWKMVSDFGPRLLLNGFIALFTLLLSGETLEVNPIRYINDWIVSLAPASLSDYICNPEGRRISYKDIRIMLDVALMSVQISRLYILALNPTYIDAVINTIPEFVSTFSSSDPGSHLDKAF